MARRETAQRVHLRDHMVFAIIKQSLARKHYVPSFREIADQVPPVRRGKLSTSQVSETIRRLEHLYGVIVRAPGKARAISLTELGHQVEVLPALEPFEPTPTPIQQPVELDRAQPDEAEHSRPMPNWWYKTIDQAFVAELDIQPRTLRIVKRAGVRMVEEAKILLKTRPAALANEPSVLVDLCQGIKAFEQLKKAG